MSLQDEEASLLRGTAGDSVVVSKKRWRYLVAGQVFFAISAVALAIALGVVVSQQPGQGDGGGDEEIPPPGPVPSVPKLPFRSPASYDIETAHSLPVQFTTTWSTWANLDVSPDGQWMVFDHLGDIYRVSLSDPGAVATPLRRGVAFDLQPRFSPDGNSILFKSDLSGCDNLWVMTRDGENARQLTAEEFRFVGSAAWAPSGQQVVGVKWHTTSRSIPAGELWLFNVTSEGTTGGAQLVGRASDTAQIGPEEPVFDPAGQYVYYSQNVADGGSQTFEYSKDPHAGIYSIRRVNVATGKVETVTGGAGGACRPQLSRNGKLLAFVRRIRFESALVLRDLETGNERVLYSGLSTDQQESSASHGVYPTFNWLADDSAIVIWSKGQFFRIDATTGVETSIPVTVNVDLKLAPTAMANVDASTGETVIPKVLQWADLNADRTVAYVTAAGHVYSHTFSTGVSQRLTSGSDYEFGPSLSPSGAQVAMSTWSDVNLGKVIIASVGVAAPVTVTTTPGRYAHASFSPAGDRLVFTRVPASWDAVSGPMHDVGTGVYVSDLTLTDGVVTAAGTPRLVVAGAAGRATFSSDGASLLVRNGGTVTRVGLETGATMATLTSSEYATEVAVSPDGTRVAYVELDNVYVATLLSEVNTTVLSSRPKDQPTSGAVRVSQNGGRYIRWSADGSRVSFLLGNTLHQFEFASVSGCNADSSDTTTFGLACALPHVSKTVISISVASRVVPSASTLFRNAVVYTMEADNVIEGGCVEVRGDKISFVGTCDDYDASSPVPVSYERDLEGGALLPGFIDIHAHWGGSSDFYVQQSWEYLANLAFGVTTLHNPSYDTVDAFAEAELVRTGKLGPRLFSTGTILYGADGTYRCEVNTLDDARENLRRLAAYGAWSAKSYNQPCRAARLRILEAARELNFAIVPEGGMAFTWNLNQIVDGHTTIEHALPVAPLYEDVIQLFARSNTSYTPTLVVNYGGIYGERYWYQETNVWENERLRRFHPTRSLEAGSMRRVKSDTRDYHHFRTSESVTALSAEGVRVQPGAHGQRQGIGFHWELWMLEQGGMTPYDVLKAATRSAADSLGLINVGSIQVGRLADIITYDAGASPLDDLANSEKVALVMVDGLLYDAATMDQLAPESKPLPEGPPLNIPSPDDGDSRHTYCA